MTLHALDFQMTDKHFPLVERRPTARPSLVCLTLLRGAWGILFWTSEKKKLVSESIGVNQKKGCTVAESWPVSLENGKYTQLLLSSCKPLPVVCWVVWLRLPVQINSQWTLSRLNLSLCDLSFSLIKQIQHTPLLRRRIISVHHYCSHVPAEGELWLLLLDNPEV